MNPEIEFKIEVEAPSARREEMLNLKVWAAQATRDKALAARKEARKAYIRTGRAVEQAERVVAEATRERCDFLRLQDEAKAERENAEARAKAQQQEADRNGLFLLTDRDGFKWLLHGISERTEYYVKSCAYTAIGKNNPPKSAGGKPTYFESGGLHRMDGATLKLVG